jgi:integrase
MGSEAPQGLASNKNGLSIIVVGARGFDPPTSWSRTKEAVRTYTNDEIRKMLAAVPGTELADLVPLIFHTATRSHETRAMRWSQADLERRFGESRPSSRRRATSCNRLTTGL